MGGWVSEDRVGKAGDCGEDCGQAASDGWRQGRWAGEEAFISMHTVEMRNSLGTEAGVKGYFFY